MKWSKYQEDIFSAFEEGKNLKIKAVAGSGKTTTLLQLANMLPQDKSGMFLAFNKSIVEELKEKVPSHITVSTLHSFGYSQIREDFKPKRVVVKDSKNWEVLDKSLKASSIFDKLEEKDVTGFKIRCLKLYDLSRMSLAQYADDIEEIAMRHDIELWFDESRVVEEMMIQGLKIKSIIDFCDMIYLPAVESLKIKVKKQDFIFVDESQDLNKAQIAMLHKMLKFDENGVCVTRLVFVGDPRQSIYGFAGADIDSWNSISEFPGIVEMPLSCSYRCSKAVISYAQELVSDIECGIDTEGIVEYRATGFNDLQGGGQVLLCRNKKPLVVAYIELLKKKIPSFIKGKDIGEDLIKLMQRCDAKTKTILFLKLDSQYKKLLNKLAEKGFKKPEFAPSAVSLAEKIEIIKLLFDEFEINNLVEMEVEMSKIFLNDKRDCVTLSTIHKSKGLEWDEVFLMGKELMPSKFAKQQWQLLQEENLHYVAATRARNALILIPVIEEKNNKEDDEMLEMEESLFDKILVNSDDED